MKAGVLHDVECRYCPVGLNKRDCTARYRPKADTGESLWIPEKQRQSPEGGRSERERERERREREDRVTEGTPTSQLHTSTAAGRGAGNMDNVPKSQ